MSPESQGPASDGMTRGESQSQSDEELARFNELTREAIQKSRYGQIVLAKLPRWVSFWLRFVGENEHVDGVSAKLVNYGLVFPKTADDSVKERIEYLHDKLCMVHYSILCDLASCHYQVENLLQAKEFKEPYLRHFHVWEATENAYSRLNYALYKLRCLWGLVGKIGAGKIGRIEDYLRENKANDTAERFEMVVRDIKDFAGSSRHFSRRASMTSPEGLLAVAYRSGGSKSAGRQSLTWEEQGEHGSYLDPFTGTPFDLESFEECANEIYKFVITEMESRLSKVGVAVDNPDSGGSVNGK